MKIGKRTGIAVSAMALLLGVAGGTAQAAQTTTTGTTGTLACSTSSATTPRTATVDTIHIELRYSTSSRCAWGRITNADPGDQVWVDRSSNGGSSWSGPLGLTTVQYGTDTYTPAYSDAGYVMRACAWNDTTGHIKCTGWY
ncbi:DUF2690 domain-containing protein [Streptomyces sp. NPDC046203]|uniref:DUF2690 domain-containing protein n=1 Tax=Streptomyces sp. NPDC046203 TaxID=3154602 RepID=UPI0033D54BD4